MGTIFEVVHINTDGKELKAQLEEVVEKLYIVIDYHKKERGGSDAWRDEVKFETPPMKKGEEKVTEDAKKLIRKKPQYTKVIRDYIDKDYKQRSTNYTVGEDTLTPIGWKGIKANDISDALNKAKTFLNGKKSQIIVLRTHGALNGNIIMMSIDNNWKFLPQDEKNKSGKSTDNVSSDGIGSILKNEKNVIYIDAQKNVDALVSLSQLIEDNGDFVIGSCHSAYNDSFISPLQVLAGSRVNMYGIYFLSDFPADKQIVIDYKISTKMKTGEEIIHIDAIENRKKTDTAYITKESVFSNTSMLSPVDMNGKSVTNYARKYPVGWKEGDKSEKLSRFGLNSKGLVY